MSRDVQSEIEQKVKENKVLVFMKGSKVWPQCGFSATVVEILNHLGAEYETQNVLEDPEVRAGIKIYSEWPTIPQIYIGGEFIGGCDIAKQMYQNGELKTALAEAGALNA
jgi:monothiol glutaredoxin